MEITGTDTVILLSLPRATITRFLDFWQKRWPELLVQLDDDKNEDFVRWSDLGGELRGKVLHPKKGEVLVARDRQMSAAWDEYGYELDRLGEGPFTLMYRPLGQINQRRGHIRMQPEEDPYERESIEAFEPYTIFVAARNLSLVTAVTPPIESGGFSEEVIGALIGLSGYSREAEELTDRWRRAADRWRQEAQWAAEAGRLAMSDLFKSL